MSATLTPREKLFLAANPEDDLAFAMALDEYRDSLRAAWDAGKLDPVYCPYDCDRCHDYPSCPCTICAEIRAGVTDQ